MRVNGIYIYGDMVVDEAHYVALMRLAKVLFRLEVIDQQTALNLAIEFQPLFV
jgi:hypothetical protein